MKKSNKKGYRAVLAQGRYCWYLVCTLLTRFGDSVDMLVYSWMVYEITGSAVWLSIVAGCNMLPTILLMPVAGVWVERWNKKRVMAVCDIARGGAVFGAALLFISGGMQPWMVVVLTMLNSTLEAFNIPAAMSVLPQLLPKQLYEHGMGLQRTLGRLMELAGMAAAPLLLAVGGLGGALLADAGIFLLAGLLMLAVRLAPADAQPGAVADADAGGGFWANARAGLGYIRKRPVVLALCIMGCVVNALAGPISSLQAAYVQQDLALSAQALSLFGICMTGTTALGTWLYPSLSKRLRASSLLWQGLGLFALSYILFGAIAWLPTAALRMLGLCIASALVGLGAALLNMVVSVCLMQQVEAGYLARVSGLFNAMMLSAMPLMSFLMAPALSVVSIRAMYVIMGVLAAALTLATARAVVFRQMDQPPQERMFADEEPSQCPDTLSA